MNSKQWAALCLVPTAAAYVQAYAVDYLSTEELQKILFPEASAFIAQPVQLTREQKSAIRKLSGMRQRWDEQLVWRVETDGMLSGWVIVDNVIGKHEYITYGVGLTPDGSVTGLEITSYRETHGGEVRDAAWRERFIGKTLDDEFKLDVDVPNISGATLSSRNILDGVKRLLALQKVVLADAQ
jgi:H+/Na+-translocating ferredoxin:NAD+ oxidoreductase subunit G